MSELVGESREAAEGLWVQPIDTPSLGDRTYLVHDGSVAWVVDPQRDIDRVLAELDRWGLTLTHVFETHVHNDYVTGGLALARETGATYLLNGADEVSFEREPLRDGQVLDVGDRMEVQVVATPGHTFTHLSYVLRDRLTGTGLAVFSGGSLLYGSTGRPDLLGSENTAALVRLQHASARRLLELAPEDAMLFPTHGFGSFCSATQAEGGDSTLGAESALNPVLLHDEETYARDLLAELGEWPAYYDHIAPLNRSGPEAADLAIPPTATAEEIRQRIARGEWVVDVRERSPFASGHVPGSLNLGLNGSFATNLGWAFDWDTPITLLAEQTDDLARAQRELARIGIDRPVAVATGSPHGWSDRPLGRFTQGAMTDLADAVRTRPLVVLDVRRTDEFAASHIEGAVNIPLHELRGRIGDVPAGEVWVHCQSGYRASLAASMLAAAGRDVVAVDDHVDNAGAAGLPITSGAVSFR